MKTLESEIAELKEELRLLEQEQKDLQKSIVKGMDNDKFKKLMILKSQIQKDIEEVQSELQPLIEMHEKGITIDEEDSYFGEQDEKIAEEDLDDKIYDNEDEGEDDEDDEDDEDEEEEEEEEDKVPLQKKPKETFEKEKQEVENPELQAKVDEILGYAMAHINQFVFDKLGTSVNENWAFESEGKGYTIQPVINCNESGNEIINVIFAIYRDETSEVGQITYNISSGFQANSKHFQWSELNFGNESVKKETIEMEKDENSEAIVKEQKEEKEENN